MTRAFEMAWAHSQVELRHLHLPTEYAHLFLRLAGHVIYTSPTIRSAKAMAANRQGAPGLWRHGISGDRPIVLATVAAQQELPLARQLLLAHGYWRLKGLDVDLVLLNEHPPSYQEELYQQPQDLIRGSEDRDRVDKPGGVFLRRAAQLSDEDRTLFLAAARVVLRGDGGSLTAPGRTVTNRAATVVPPALVQTQPPQGLAARGRPRPRPGRLLFDNELLAASAKTAPRM